MKPALRRTATFLGCLLLAGLVGAGAGLLLGGWAKSLAGGLE